MRLFDERLRIPDHAGQEPYDRLDDRERRDLSPVEDVVPQRDLLGIHAVAEMRHHARVDALVPSAGEDESLTGRELGGERLRVRDTRRSGYDKGGALDV